MSPREAFSLRALSPLFRRRPASSFSARFSGLLPVCGRPTAMLPAWSTPLHAARRYTSSLPPRSSTHGGTSSSRDAAEDDDPVFSFVLPHRTMPLTKLAKLLPDEVLEQLENGLKSHLEKFPSRYRLLRGKNSLLHVQCEVTSGKEGSKGANRGEKETPRDKAAVACIRKSPGRFMTLESLMSCTHVTSPLPGAACVASHGEKGEEHIHMLEHFFREHVRPVGHAELWVLTEEYTLVNSPSSSSAAAATKEAAAIGPEETASADIEKTGAAGEKAVLQAFRWVQVADESSLDEVKEVLRGETRRDVLGKGMDGKAAPRGDASSVTAFTRSSSFVRFCVPSVSSTRGGATLAPHNVESLVEDYNLYRMCRALRTSTFMRLPELQDIVGEWLTQPLAVVLAIAGEESSKAEGLKDADAGRSLLNFERDPSDPARIIGVRFWLDEERYLPSLYRSASLTELEKALAEVGTTRGKSLSKLPNHLRVRVIDTTRLLKRCIALRELGASPLCHPDVLAYYVFDILPLDGQLLLTGHLPQLLPESVRRITDARSRAWLKGYPHLFRLVEIPPQVYVQRMDAPAPDGEEDHTMDCSQQAQEEDKDTARSSSRTTHDYKDQLLNDPEEQLRLLVSIVAARLEVCGARKLLPSHIPKFISSKVRRKMFPRGSGGITEYLRRHPDVFILTSGIHPHEPVVTLAPKYHPSPHSPPTNPTAETNTADGTKEGE
ncbi:uncharacterized protein Tco025E_06973 [Trypanosoma conorhini]|uniref:Uncharacterized protein n=1 Tax=Trypanosoma conorhini TaxID=83891 RepID=A0A422NW73_9TRYP|nr:uncharacterized protein Tco025E_06973 [Trypanosoma conorhini]RNF09752.1 hypothetical protein Tco025E_06973 [Trypanosoma conorhini]